MPEKKFYKKKIFIVLSIFFLLLFIGLIYFASVALVEPPIPDDMSSLKLQREEKSKGFYTIGNNWFRKSKSGLYELYAEGKPFERGVIIGKLSKELVVRQEDYFSEQINTLIPSRFYLHFLKYFIGWFNRHLDENVSKEYKEEIYGISKSASDRYQYIGSNYQRLLNYHAAHDIGHALQNMAMVGCTSFGTWNSRSADSTMIIGRNFDFYVGDKFAEDKIIAFINPSEGYKFMMVTWGGFMGVVSGMNEKGLCLTLNAAKSSIPSGAATPVSLVAREILQNAKNFKEAYAIASKRKMFVSESFLIGSAEDKNAAIIEKTPDSIAVYSSEKDYILCTNHFQSKELLNLDINQEQIKESASEYRYRRLRELFDANNKNTVQRTVEILRDRQGLKGADIGMGNEKALNQLMAHHAIVFEPEKLIVRVSTSHWQLGPFVAYDLKKIFSMPHLTEDMEIQEEELSIPADPFLYSENFRKFEKYRGFKRMLAEGKSIVPDSLIASNPSYYYTYVLAGDYYFKNKLYVKALVTYKTALKKEISTKIEEDKINEKILECKEKLDL